MPVEMPEVQASVESSPVEDLSVESGISHQALEQIQDEQARQQLETLRRFSALKEREAREKEASIQILNRQIAQMKERLTRSEEERRRHTLAHEESETVRRSLQDTIDQHQHHISKLEQKHKEDMKALMLRHDNALFQANRAERKLTEFRERVKNDIVQIRSRERELANKLELQKRDAEALLTAKDERLMQLKREIDRLEYEIENMQERMLEETQRAEERASRLSRAVQSLKLAEGVLSGIQEEVLPNAAIPEEGKDPGSEGEAA